MFLFALQGGHGSSSFYAMGEMISTVGGGGVNVLCNTWHNNKKPEVYAKKKQKPKKTKYCFAADTKSRSGPPASTLTIMQQQWQQHSCAHVHFLPVQPNHLRSPHTRPSLSPTIWHTHRTDGQVGRRRQAPVANSPSPVADLPLTGGKRWYQLSRYPLWK